jgi:hypothetical protein
LKFENGELKSESQNSKLQNRNQDLENGNFNSANRRHGVAVARCASFAFPVSGFKSLISVALGCSSVFGQFRFSSFELSASSFEFRIEIVANGLLKIYALVPIG